MSWLAGAAFLASLSYFLYRYATTFGRPATDGTALGAGIWNVTLFTAFAFHHSLFARTPVRQWVAAACPGLERSVYVLVASVLFALTCALWQQLPGFVWQVTGPARWLCAGLQLGGVVLFLWSAAIIDIGELAGLSAPEVAEPGDQAFKTDGPYGVVRHPIYLGWILFVFSAPEMTTTRTVFAAVSSLYIVLAIPLEERTLRATTAGAYEHYARTVRWRLLPGVW